MRRSITKHDISIKITRLNDESDHIIFRLINLKRLIYQCKTGSLLWDKMIVKRKQLETRLNLIEDEIEDLKKL